MSDHDSLIYKVLTDAQWDLFQREQRFEGAPIDQQDGFIHFSARHQVAKTVAKHFAGQSDLILVEISTEPLGEALRWELSRGGDDFPHLYDSLDYSTVQRWWPLPLEGESHQFPEEWKH